MDENFSINMVFEVKDKKVVRVYKSKAWCSIGANVWW
jgi:hypothetical protein